MAGRRLLRRRPSASDDLDLQSFFSRLPEHFTDRHPRKSGVRSLSASMVVSENSGTGAEAKCTFMSTPNCSSSVFPEVGFEPGEKLFSDVPKDRGSGHAAPFVPLRLVEDHQDCNLRSSAGKNPMNDVLTRSLE